jgi:hypothetical protein
MLTLLQLLEALEGDLELVRRVELRGVVLDRDTEKRHDRHDEDCVERIDGGCTRFGRVGGVESEVRSVDVGAAGRKEVAVARCVYLGAVRDVRVVTNRGGLSQIALAATIGGA